jgi:oxygen-independent coproporphyrinogen-3 oxidase
MPHLYVHVPFCRRRCSYCDFAIAVRKTVPSGEYLDAIRTEARLLRDAGRWSEEPLASVYFGGGTPSLLDPDALRAMLDHLVAAPLAGAEVTIEANPDDVTPARAAAWIAMGVNRVSLGVQSFDERALRWMHRTHDGETAVRAVRLLRDAGVENISLDLIFALPEALARDWSRDLDRALALEPEHLSLYGLTVEERTPLGRWVSRGAARAADDDRYAREYLEAHARLERAGLELYEVSNAARPGRQSRHNRAYWSGRSYAGLGPSAHSFDGTTRRWNTPAWEAYRRALRENRSPVESEERLTPEQQRLEALYLGLRTRQGVPVQACSEDAVAAARQAGWLVVCDGYIRCTPEGWLRLDALVTVLTGAAASA